MTENPNDDPQTRRYVGPDAPDAEPAPDPVTDPAPTPDVPDVDPDGDPEPLPPQDPLPEGGQRENAETSLDQPSEDLS